MNCEAVQNRLLALTESPRLPDELRDHLAGCPGCRTFLSGLGRLDELLAAIPVPPPSEEVKAAFLARVTEAGPIITHIPVIPRRDSAVHLRALSARGWWRYAAGMAATVLLAVGGWLLFSGKKQPELAERDGPRHELLNKLVRKDIALARAATPDERLRIWSDVTVDLRSEMQAVHQQAPTEDLKALADLFDKAARDGVLKQSTLLPDHLPADRRQALLSDVTRKLADAEADAARLLQTTPTLKQEPLRQIVRTARDVRLQLEQRAKGAT